MLKNEITSSTCHPYFKQLCPLPPGSFHLWENERIQWCTFCQKNIHFVKSNEEFTKLQKETQQSNKRVCIAYKETDVCIIGELAPPYNADAPNYSSILVQSDSPAPPKKFNISAPEPLETTCRNSRCPHLWNALLPTKDPRYNGRCPQCKKSVRFTKSTEELKHAQHNKRVVTTLKTTPHQQI